MLVTVLVSLTAWGLLTLSLVLARWRIMRYHALMDEITLR
jgi:hypothetical protein